jgi:hypothetical protein
MVLSVTYLTLRYVAIPQLGSMAPEKILRTEKGLGDPGAPVRYAG